MHFILKVRLQRIIESARSEEKMIELTPANLIMMAGAILLIAAIFIFMVKREMK